MPLVSMTTHLTGNKAHGDTDQCSQPAYNFYSTNKLHSSIISHYLNSHNHFSKYVISPRRKLNAFKCPHIVTGSLNRLQLTIQN